MNFVPVCDRLVFGVIIALMAGSILRLICSVDIEFQKESGRKMLLSLVILCLLGTCLLPASVYKRPFWEQGGYMIMLIYLTSCAVMDMQIQKVYDFLHYIGLISVGVLAIKAQPDFAIGWELILFALIQWLIFSGMYGDADVAMYMVCAAFLATEGKGLEEYLLHMLVTFALLGIVQGVKGNISRQGNLKRPVALIPYIVIGFLVII